MSKKESNITLIEKLSTTYDDNTIFIIDDISKDSLQEVIIDLSLPLSHRMKAINIFYENYGEENIIDMINRLSTMYMFSGTKNLEKYLYEMSTNSIISFFLKLICAKSICFFKPSDEIGYVCIDLICQKMDLTLPAPCQFEAICLLMCYNKYKVRTKKHLCTFINNQQLDCDYRYKSILSIENKNINNTKYFIKHSLTTFFKNKKNRTLYRILSGQYMMQNCKITSNELDLIENTLIQFSQDPDLDYNLRADSADVILRVGSEQNKITARKVIMMLGRENNSLHNKTIFDNAQNVHTNEIESSVLDCLEFLASMDMKTISNIPGTDFITFEYVKKQIQQILKEQNPKNKNKSSTNTPTAPSEILIPIEERKGKGKRKRKRI